MKKMAFDFIEDPGHGWLRLSPYQALALNITTHDLTSCSYVCQRTGALYAEEDCDMATVLAAHHKATGMMPEIRSTYSNMESPIRNLPRCSGRFPGWKDAMRYLEEVRA